MTFHKYNVQRTLKKIKEQFPENYPLLEDFAEDLLANGVSESRVHTYLIWLKNLLKIVPKKFEDWTKKDVRKVINAYALRVKRGEISENTLIEVKKTLKRFFKWLEKEELVRLVYHWKEADDSDTKRLDHKGRIYGNDGSLHEFKR